MFKGHYLPILGVLALNIGDTQVLARKTASQGFLWPFRDYFMVSILCWVPLVIIHFRLGFSLKKAIQRFWGTPMAMETPTISSFQALRVSRHGS